MVFNAAVKRGSDIETCRVAGASARLVRRVLLKQFRASAIASGDGEIAYFRRWSLTHFFASRAMVFNTLRAVQKLGSSRLVNGRQFSEGAA